MTDEATETYSPAAIKKQVALVMAALKVRNELKDSIETQIAELTATYSEECEKLADMRGTGAFSFKDFRGSISSKSGNYFLKKLPNSDIEKY